VVLDQLITPLSPRKFLDEFWEKRPFYLDGENVRNFNEIITIDDLDKFLSRTDIRHPSLRLVKNGSEIALEDYTRELRLGPHVSHDLIDNEKVFANFNEGATIVLQSLQHNISQFGLFTNALEVAVGCNVHGSCFITPPNAKGFTSHYDTYSFFALQIAGTKRWEIYPRTRLPPIDEDRDTEEPWVACEPCRTHLLKPGDLLYIPRGWYHAATTTNSTSIHLTIGLFLPTWLDIIRSALIRLHMTEELRLVPANFSAGRELHLDKGDISRIIDFLSKNMDLEGGLEDLKSKYFGRHVDTRSRRLKDLIGLEGLSDTSRVGIQSMLPYKKVQADHGGLHLLFLGKEISLPPAATGTIAFLEKNGSARICDIIDAVDISSRRIIIEALLREGFLTLRSG
jgi:ribosomal protein L16 Arg81 hydroxylase